MVDLISFLVSDKLFGWLPVRDFVSVIFFGVSLAVLLYFGFTKQPGKFTVWIVGISFWMLGMVFDGLRRVEGWEALRIAEHSFQLAGSIVIAYAAYETRKGLKWDISEVAGSKGAKD